MWSFSSLLEKLNLSKADGLFYYEDLLSNKTDFLSVRTKDILQNHVKPNAFFCINNEPVILFFDKNDDIIEIQKIIWNFNLSPAIFINNGNEWIIKNGFKLLDNKSELDTLSNNIADFEYFKLITGETWEKYQKEFDYKNRVDYHLLDNIDSARKILINQHYLPHKIANHLIGRVIFIRYLLDRGVDLTQYGILKKEDFYNFLDNKENTYLFFRRIKEDFNGNLFPLDYVMGNTSVKEEERVNEGHLSVIKLLLQGATIHKDNTSILSLFDIYDFSVIPIEFVSNVYEKFIGVENQEKEGAYYTPLFLVDYIQKETISKYFEKNPTEYNCKVLDPACGSGIFLVEALRQILLQYKNNNPSCQDDYDQYKIKLKELLTDNIFGLDKDENAIDVAIFSLYITLLDNLNPKTIVGFKFPILKNKNFFVDDFFNTEENEESFNTIFKKQYFQFIIGNPPWATKHSKEKQPFEKYIEKRKREENSNLDIVQREIAEAFLVRVSDFSFNETAFIVVSKILYKLKKQGVFRKYFLNNFVIRQVVELSSVRHLIFNNSNDSAVAPASILFYRKENDIEKIKKNIVKHISLKPNIFFKTFKLMVIEKYDVKEILQQYFMEDDWAWKVFVYGNILDYYFIKRLKKNPSLYEYISNKKEFKFGKGILVKGGDKGDISKHKKIKYSINSIDKGLQAYTIKYTDNFLSNMNYVHRPRKIDLFKSPVLLVGKGIDKQFRAKACISFKDVIYTDAITGIKPLTEKSKSIIYFIEGVFNSNLFSYFMTITGSSVGIEREQSHDKDDKFSFPIMEINDYNDIKEKLQNIEYNIENIEKEIIKVHNIEKINKEITDLKSTIKKIEKETFNTKKKQQLKDLIEKIKENLDNKILDFYNLSNQEKSLVDYTNSVTIPLLKGSNEQSQKVIKELPYQSNILGSYAQIFIDHFRKRFNSDGHFFEVEIIHSKHTILMKFKVVSEPSKFENSIEWNKKGNKELLKNITDLGFENLSDNLYLQKDIKGFEPDYFYIAKPNQYKSWHSALAYLDLLEFIEAFFKIERGDYDEN